MSSQVNTKEKTAMVYIIRCKATPGRILEGKILGKRQIDRPRKTFIKPSLI